MPIKFKCMYCGRQYKVEESNAGKSFKCKQCSHAVKVPEPKAPEPKVAPQKAKPKQTDGPEPPGVPVTAAHQPAVQQPAAHYGQYDGLGRYGYRQHDDAYRRLNLPFLFGVAVVFLGLILPWLSFPKGSIAPSEDPGYVSCFQLPFVIRSQVNDEREKLEEVLSDRNASYDERERALGYFDSLAAPTYSLFALFLIPILTALALVDELRTANSGENRWYVRLIAAVSPYLAFMIIVIIFVVAAIQLGDVAARDGSEESRYSPYEFIGIGFWVVLMGSLMLVVSIFTSPKPSIVERTAPFRPPQSPTHPVGQQAHPGIPVKADRPSPKLPSPKLPSPKLPSPKLPSPKLPPRR